MNRVQMCIGKFAQKYRLKNFLRGIQSEKEGREKEYTKQNEKNIRKGKEPDIPQDLQLYFHVMTETLIRETYCSDNFLFVCHFARTIKEKLLLCNSQRELFLKEVNNRETMPDIEANNDTYCLLNEYKSSRCYGDRS